MKMFAKIFLIFLPSVRLFFSFSRLFYHVNDIHYLRVIAFIMYAFTQCSLEFFIKLLIIIPNYYGFLVNFNLFSFISSTTLAVTNLWSPPFQILLSFSKNNVSFVFGICIRTSPYPVFVAIFLGLNNSYEIYFNNEFDDEMFEKAYCGSVLSKTSTSDTGLVQRLSKTYLHFRNSAIITLLREMARNLKISHERVRSILVNKLNLRHLSLGLVKRANFDTKTVSQQIF